MTAGQSHELQEQQGSLPGAILLIAGCCIGAGMLGLPVLSALAGFTPSFFMFLVGWLFMTSTALLLLEVNLWFSDEVSLISMAGRTLGFFGKAVAWACFLFLFYALGVAYLAGSGELLAGFALEVFGEVIPNWIGALSVCLLFGLFIFLGTHSVDLCNRLLMGGLILSYLLLVGLGAPHVRTENLMYADWKAALAVLPVMIISFGFHNLVPSIKNYLQGNASQIRLAVILGSTIPLVIYLIWEWLMLGLVPVEGQGGFVDLIEKGGMATELLKVVIGSSWVVDITHYFALFAILTSFLGNSLSFVDFLSDGLNIKKVGLGKILLCLLVIAPPFALALAYPGIFLIALTYAGAFGAVILFGVLPVLMVWSGRYWCDIKGEKMLPGGKLTLVVLLLFSLAVMALQLLVDMV